MFDKRFLVVQTLQTWIYLISFNGDTDCDEDATSKTNMAGTFNDCEMFLELHILEQKLYIWDCECGLYSVIV